MSSADCKSQLGWGPVWDTEKRELTSLSKPPHLTSEKTRRSDDLTNIIKSAIQLKQIRPGQRLPTERELAAHYKMGRLVVREGLRTLESQGLVTVKLGSKGGYYVEDLSPRKVSMPLTSALKFADISLENLLEARLGLEGEIIRLAAKNATRKDVRKLRDNVELTKLLAETSASALVEKVHEFHLLLAEASHNPIYLVMMHSIVEVIMATMRTLGYRSIVSEKTLDEHEQIVESLERQDFVEAGERLKLHIVNDERRLLQRAKKTLGRSASSVRADRLGLN